MTVKSLAAAAVLAAVLAPAGPAHAEFVIGVAGPMTGAFADVGASIVTGAQAAVDELNAAGGLAGEEVVLEVVDDKCDGPTGAAVANRLVGRGARLVVGHACTAAAIPAASVYVENGVVFISPSASNPRLTDERIGPGVFRLAPRSDGQARAIVDHLSTGDSPRRVGFVHDGTAYGQGLVDQARSLYEAAGGKPALATAFTPGEKSQNALVGAIQDAGLTDLVVGAQQADAAVIATELRARRLPARIVGGDPLGLEEFIDLAGPAGEGVVFVLPYDWRRQAGTSDAILSIAAHGAAPNSTNLLAFGAVQAYAAAVAAVGTGFDEVVQRLQSGETTLFGAPLRFDDKGDLIGPGFVLYTWNGRTPVPVE